MCPQIPPLDLKKMATGGGGWSLRLTSSRAGRVGPSRGILRRAGPSRMRRGYEGRGGAGEGSGALLLFSRCKQQREASQGEST